MTSDRIPSSEWDRVHELAAEIANASMQDDSILYDAKTEAMLYYLRELRSRYGDLPSILGTLGDYTDDEVERYDLYTRGVTEAQRIGDGKKFEILVESILELEFLNQDQRSFWQTQQSELKIEQTGCTERRDRVSVDSQTSIGPASVSRAFGKKMKQ